MKIRGSISDLSRFELVLWLSSLIIVTASFFAFSSEDYLTLISSLIGVTALIFLAKGYVIGQILIVIFSIFYGIISFYFHYYGEMITYLGMTSPIAILTVISWLRHPYKKTAEVEVHRMTYIQVIVMLILTVLVTFAFCFILKALDTANMFFSTASVATSFLASYMTFMRSSYYALGYAANDIVLIILWIMATITDISYFPMIVCFVIFFINDFYGFINWQKMKKRQMLNK